MPQFLTLNTKKCKPTFLNFMGAKSTPLANSVNTARQ